MKRLFPFFTAIFFSANVFATAQQPDYLLIDQDTLKLHSNPLQAYFEKHPLPDKLMRSSSSGNWRGYVAYFKFVNNQLAVENIYKNHYVTDEKGRHSYSLVSIYKDVFGEVPNFSCDFYSGLLVCPYGEIVQYVHMGYSSVYEYYKLIEIKSGIKVKSKDLFGDQFLKFKRDYYTYFKTTAEYQERAKQFKEVMGDIDRELFEPIEREKKRNKRAPKENKYLKQKESELEAEREMDSFMFLFMDDYIKTIDIPNN